MFRKRMINLEKAKSLQNFFLDLSYPTWRIFINFCCFLSKYWFVCLSLGFSHLFFMIFRDNLKLGSFITRNYKTILTFVMFDKHICWRNLHAKYRFTVSFQLFYIYNFDNYTHIFLNIPVCTNFFSQSAN